MKYIKTMIFVLVLLFAFGMNAQAQDYYRPWVKAQDLTVKNVPVFESGLGIETSGNVWYVDSGASGTAAGTSWTNACLTVDAAINLATASNGDLIRVAAGHAESFTAADGFDLDKAGITIYHEGSIGAQAIYTFADTDATIAVGAAGCRIFGGQYLAGISAVVIGIAVEAAGDNFEFIDPYFPEPTTSSFEFIDAIDLASGADGVKIVRPGYFSMDATGASHFVEMGNGVNKNFTLIDPYIYGEFAVAAVWSDTADEEVLISGGNITNATNGQHAIEFTSTAAGTIQDIVVRTDAQATAVDPGSLSMSNLLWAGDTSVDSTSTPVVLGAAGAASIGTVNATTTDSLHGKIGTDTEMADSSLYDLNVADQVDLDAILADTVILTANTVMATSKSLTPIATGDLFAVSGGPIKIVEIIGVVTDTVQSQANSVKLLIDPTAPAADTDICAALEINADAIGTVYTITGTFANAMVETTNGVVAGLVTEIIAPIGMIELDGTASNTGTIVWYIRYEPLSALSVVTAQ